VCFVTSVVTQSITTEILELGAAWFMQAAWEFGYEKEGDLLLVAIMRTNAPVNPSILKENCPILFG
jgi:hypothetical protein